MNRSRFINMFIILFLGISVSLYAAPANNTSTITQDFKFYYQWNLKDTVVSGFTTTANLKSIQDYIRSLDAQKYNSEWKTNTNAPKAVGNSASSAVRLSTQTDGSLNAKLPGAEPYYFWIALRTLSNADLNVTATPLKYVDSGANVHIIPYDLTFTDKSAASTVATAKVGGNISDVAGEYAPDETSKTIKLGTKNEGLFWSYIGEMDITADATYAYPATYTADLTVELTLM